MVLRRLRTWAGRLRRDIHALYLAYRDPRTPWYARAVGALVAAYALSPVDLIPDFVPILGYLDDLVLLPAGIALAVRLIPRDVMEDCRARAEQAPLLPGIRAGIAVVVAVWVVVAVVVTGLVLRRILR